MIPDPFEHEPLENVFRALHSDEELLSPEELNESLRARGLDPNATIVAVSAKVTEFLKSRRLSWRDVAKQKQADLQAAAARAVSWSTKKKEEIEAAFSQAQEGRYGPATRMKLQAAFRNLSNIPTEDKASFLDEIDTLQLLKDGSPPPPEGTK